MIGFNIGDIIGSIAVNKDWDLFDDDYHSY